MKKWRLVVGLTGGIGSGKSTVLAMLKKKGAYVLDSDAIVHDLLRNDRRVKQAIRRTFGNEMFDSKGQLDRARMAGVVFRSGTQRKKLEKILHPRVRQAIFSALNKKKGTIAVVDVPLLFEVGWWNKRFDEILVVNAGRTKRFERLRKKGYTDTAIRNRFKSQWPLAKKVKRADFVVNNNGSMSETEKQIQVIWKSLLNLSKGE